MVTQKYNKMYNCRKMERGKIYFISILIILFLVEIKMKFDKSSVKVINSDVGLNAKIAIIAVNAKICIKLM